MDINIPPLYKEFGEYSNYRNFPLDIDGLKPVERRILFSAYQIARDKLTKCAKIDGYVLGNYHPHASSYGSIVQLVRQGFLDEQGNFGSTVGIEPLGPAAMRYTETKLSKFILHSVFRYIKYVDWEINDLGENEPLYLPSMFPLCLIGKEYTQGIGFGYKTFIPCYKIEDLHKRLMWLLGLTKIKPTIKPISDCTILSSDSNLEDLLTTGKAKILVEGIIKTNAIKNIAILKSWPSGKRFESLLSKFNKELENQDIGFRDASVMETEIVFEVLKQRNRDNIFNIFIDKLKEAIKGYVSFEVTVVDKNHKVKVKSIDDMLLDTFKSFIKSNTLMLEDEYKKNNEALEELKLLKIIKPFLSISLKSNNTPDEIIKDISIKSKIDEKIIKMLFTKYRITKLLNINIDENDLLNKMKSCKESLNNINQVVLNQYKEILGDMSSM